MGWGIGINSGRANFAELPHLILQRLKVEGSSHESTTLTTASTKDTPFRIQSSSGCRPLVPEAFEATSPSCPPNTLSRRASKKFDSSSVIPLRGAQLQGTMELFSGAFNSLIPIRSFLHRAYPTMKKNNPHTPIMMREALGTEPRVFARYGMGLRTLRKRQC